MKERRAREREVQERRKWSTMAQEEEAEEDDDNATLQDCIDRQRKVTTVRTKSKRIALTPLDDEGNCRRVRKKSKGIQELLAAAGPAVAPQSDETPVCSTQPIKPRRHGVETEDNEVKDSKKRKVRKKRREVVDDVVEGEGIDRRVIQDAELRYNIYDHMEDVPSSELSRKIFILVAKVELGDGQRHDSIANSDNQSVPGTGTLGSPTSGSRLLTEDLFLPIDGYHTCEDAGNCPRIPCLEKVLDHLDRMSEDQLKLWFKAITGEVFMSRNGEKVRGRLRRMIRCRVKELIKSQYAESTVSSHSWRSSLEMQPEFGALSPPPMPVVVSDSLTDSPGSKLSASNAGDGCVGAEDAVQSGKPPTERAPSVSPSASSEISRGFTFQLPAARNSSTKEASTNSSVDDPEPVLPAVTARITRSKARGLVKNSGAEQEDDLNEARCLEMNQDLYYSSSDRNLPTTPEEFEVPGFHPPVCLSGGSVDCGPGSKPAEGAAAEQAAATRSGKESSTVEKELRGFSSPAHCDLNGLLVEGAAEETTKAATRSRKKSFSDQEAFGEHSPPTDHSVYALPVENTSAGTATAATRCRKKSFAVEKFVREVSSSADRDVSGLHIEGAAAETSAVATRSRKRRDVVTDKGLEEVPSSTDCDVVGLQLEAAAAETATASIRSRKKSFAAENLFGEVSTSADSNADGVPVDGGAVQPTGAPTRLRKKREYVAAEKVFREFSSPAECRVSGPPVEIVAAEPTSAATRSRKKISDVQEVRGEVACLADYDPSRLQVESKAVPKTAAATRWHKYRGFVAAQKVHGGVSSPADCIVGGVPVEGSAATRSRKSRYTVEEVLEGGSSLADCDLSGQLTERVARETATAPARPREETGFVALQKVLVEVLSLPDCDVIGPLVDTAATDTTPSVTGSQKKSFAVKKDFGAVSHSADSGVNRLPEEVGAAESKAAGASSQDKREAVSEDLLEKVVTLAACDISGTPREGAAVETSSLAVEKFPPEVSSSAGCDVDGLLSKGGGGEATAVATQRDFVAAEEVLGNVSTSAREVNDFLARDAAAESRRAVRGSDEERDPVAVEEVLGDVHSSNLACNRELPSISAEELAQLVQSSQPGAECLPSLSDVIMNLLSDISAKASQSKSEGTALGSQESSGTVIRQSETESLIGTKVATAEEASQSNLIAAASPPATTSSVLEKVVEVINYPGSEGTLMSMPSEPQCESAISVCKHDHVANESLMEIDGNSEPELVSKEPTTNLSSPMANCPGGEASSCKFEESSELCCSVVVTICDARTGAPSGLDTVCHTGKVQVEQGSAPEGAHPEPHTISSSNLFVCPAPSSGSVLEVTSDWLFNTKCRDFPIGDGYVCLPSQEEIAKPTDSFVVGVSSSSMPSSAALFEDNVQVPSTGLRLGGEHLAPLDTTYGCVEGEEMVRETGDGLLFEQFTAERSSSLWPSEDEKKTYIPSPNGYKMEGLPDSKLVVGTDSMSGGTGKWQLLRCDSRRSKESAAETAGKIEVSSLPKVWRDAGEFLDELDSVYLMIDTVRSSLSDSLHKRKHHDSDLDDDRTKCPGNAVGFGYGPPRTRQCVELSPEERCAVTEKLVVEADDVWKAGGDLEYLGDVEQPEVEQTGPSTSILGHMSVHAEKSPVSDEVQDPVHSQYHPELWIDDERRDEGTTVYDEPAPSEKQIAMHDNCSGTTMFRRKVCLSPPRPYMGDSYLGAPPPFHSPASQSTSPDESSPEAVVKSDACVDLLACERLVQEDDLDDSERSSGVLFTRKKKLLREENEDLSPSLPPMRLKLPSGRARHVAGAINKFKLRSARGWRYSEAEALDGKRRATSAASLSPNSSDEDSGDSSTEQETSTLESAPSEEQSGQKLSLVLSPTSPQCSLPPPGPGSCSSNPQQESISGPDGHVAPPCTARCTKGILKTSPKCKECVELRFQARTASDFVASQMKTFGEVAGRLTREIQDLRSILETQVSSSYDRLQEEDAMHDKDKAISRSRDTERSAEKNLTLLLRDCKRFCKLTAKRPQRRIVFADEAGKKLCHVKTFESAPALARPLWDIL